MGRAKARGPLVHVGLGVALVLAGCTSPRQESEPQAARAKPGEIVIFSWILYKSRAHRKRVTAKVMKDPRILKMMNEMPFDGKRMAYGGFKVIVDL